MFYTQTRESVSWQMIKYLKKYRLKKNRLESNLKKIINKIKAKKKGKKVCIKEAFCYELYYY